MVSDKVPQQIAEIPESTITLFHPSASLPHYPHTTLTKIRKLLDRRVGDSDGDIFADAAGQFGIDGSSHNLQRIVVHFLFWLLRFQGGDEGTAVGTKTRMNNGNC